MSSPSHFNCLSLDRTNMVSFSDDTLRIVRVIRNLQRNASSQNTDVFHDIPVNNICSHGIENLVSPATMRICTSVKARVIGCVLNEQNNQDQHEFQGETVLHKLLWPFLLGQAAGLVLFVCTTPSIVRLQVCPELTKLKVCLCR